MSSFPERIYWRAPYFLKCWLASANARRLDRWRYGPAYEQIRCDIASREGWSAQRWFDYQCARLSEVICLAARHVPYYRRVFAEAGVAPESIRTPADMSRLPVLEKKVVREAPESLLDERLGCRRLMVLHTSGTTGTPLTLYRDEWLNAAAFAYLDARWHAVAGVRRRHDRSVSIGGQVVAAPDRDRPPFWVRNDRWNQLYMSSFHLAPKHLDAYVEALRAFAPAYVEGYPSSIHALARHIVESGLKPLSVRACFTLAETLFEHQREVVRGAFGCSVYNQYGCGEMAVFAAECAEGSMHLSPEFGIVEVLDEHDRPVTSGQGGQFVCTSLINRVQPFIRYRLGDSGSLQDGQCRCGSPLPLLGRLDGRTDDVVILRDGRRIGCLDPMCSGARGIAEAQVVQDDYDRFRVRIVPGPDYREADGRHVADDLARRLSGATVGIELVDHIERTRAGKFTAVICNLPGHGDRSPGGS